MEKCQIKKCPNNTDSLLNINIYAEQQETIKLNICFKCQLEKGIFKLKSLYDNGVDSLKITIPFKQGTYKVKIISRIYILENIQQNFQSFLNLNVQKSKNSCPTCRLNNNYSPGDQNEFCYNCFNKNLQKLIQILKQIQNDEANYKKYIENLKTQEMSEDIKQIYESHIKDLQNVFTMKFFESHTIKYPQINQANIDKSKNLQQSDQNNNDQSQKNAEIGQGQKAVYLQFLDQQIQNLKQMIEIQQQQKQKQQNSIDAFVNDQIQKSKLENLQLQEHLKDLDVNISQLSSQYQNIYDQFQIQKQKQNQQP